MKFKEYLLLDNARDLIAMLDMFPNFKEYASKRYANFTLKYDEEIFGDLFISVIMNHSVELRLLESASNWSKKDFNESMYGNVSSGTNTSTTNATSRNNLGYSGYNVDNDDFQSNVGESTQFNENIGNSKQVNYLAYVSAINMQEYSQNWKDINKDIIKLFNLFYEL